MNKGRLVLFDFDGTITRKDSFMEFIRFYKGNLHFMLGIMVLMPILVMFKLGLIKNWVAKQMVLKFFFQKEYMEKFGEKCKKFALEIVPEIVKPEAKSTIERHLRNGDRVIIVSASAEDWLIDWCKAMNVELIATRLEKIDGRITGKIEGKNCYNSEKVKRIKQYLDITEYTEIYAYGDSKGDKAMLELANFKFYKTTV